VLVRHDEKVSIARLLTFLEHGERLANECAKAQAALAPDSGSRRFLLSQARQEAAHGIVFQGAIAGWHRGISALRRFCLRWKSIGNFSTRRWPDRTCSKHFWLSR
jgi:hypothetical protein